MAASQWENAAHYHITSLHVNTLGHEVEEQPEEQQQRLNAHPAHRDKRSKDEQVTPHQ